MTNHWSDIANSTNIVVWGANPVENHPACVAHMNRARFPKQFFKFLADGVTPDPRANKTPAKLIVVDPRKTRTALQVDESRGDRYIRIRPGTDIALGNGLMRYMINKIEALPGTDPTRVAFFAYLNQSGNGSFFNDGAASGTAVLDESVVLTGTAATALANAGIYTTPAIVVTSSDGLTTYAATDYTLDAANGTLARTATSAIPSGATVLVDYTYGACALMTNVAGSSKYTDARFLLTADGTDYDRETKNPGTSRQITAFPKKAASVTADPNTVYNRFKKHLEPYTLAVTADICGCTTADIEFLGNAFIANSRCATSPVTITDRSVTMTGTVAQTLGHTGLTGVVVTSSDGLTTYTLTTDYTIDATQGTITRVATGSITAGQTVLVDFTGTPSDPRDPAYRATTMLYAMGLTQHTCGGQNVKTFAEIQTLMGNMGRAGGGINALRGIHNVQGSTDMGLLYGNIPAYSGNPGTQVNGGPNWNTTPSSNNAFGMYMDALWGTPLSGTGNKLQMNNSYDDAYNTAAMGLQQRGFYNMTLKWFGDYTTINGMALGAAKRAAVDACYSLWPKGNGDDHITMFRKMGTGATKAAVVWGQNPAVTEPNQGAVRAGLYNLDLLVCVDMFENETAAVPRKNGGVTFLIPTASHVEKAGSATNSGRTLQWRYKAAEPSGNTKDDNELLLRFASALDTAGAFSHIKSVWDTNGITYDTSVYKQLYGNPYGGYLPGTNTFAGVSGAAEMVTLRKVISDPLTYQATPVVDESITLTGTTATSLAHANLMATVVVKSSDGLTTYTQGTHYTVDYPGGKITRTSTSTIPSGASVLVTYAYNGTVTGSEWVAEAVYREMCLPSANGGTLWIYTGAYNNLSTSPTDNKAAWQPAWVCLNRAKNRDRTDDGNTLAYHGWGYAWLVNRRVLYNNSEVVGDVADFFMGPDSASRLFVSTSTAVLNYSRWYRTIHRLSDLPSPVLAGDTTSPHYAGTAYSLAGRFSAHTEPYETPRQNLLAKWGRNTRYTATAPASNLPWNLVKDDTRVAGRGYVNGVGGKTVTDPSAASFPLVLTSIRCVEHFQGGPITRNNWWNVELEPEPWIEINSSDAGKYGIKDGDYVKVITARIVNDAGATVMPASYGSGFRARVGTGLTSSQKVAPGVVAIPWHWGDKGLSTGSRANDICIDAFDSNTAIPEYKACLCKIEKM